MKKYIHCFNPLKKVVALFLFLSITHVSVYATIAVTQVTHATVDTDVSGTSGAPTFNCDGAIDITADGNAGPFTFLWSDDRDTEDRTDLCPGTYYVTVTNAFGCTKSMSKFAFSDDMNWITPISRLVFTCLNCSVPTVQEV